MNKSQFINIALLYRKMAGEKLSEEERQAFDEWYNKSEEHRCYYKRFCLQQEKVMERRCSRVDVQKGLKKVRRQRRLHANGWGKIGMVASLLLLMTIGVMYWQDSHLKEKSENKLSNQLFPGHKSVILSLDGGQKIVIDSVSSQRRVGKDCVEIRIEKGLLRYRQDSLIVNSPAFNELVVPPSGEYIVELADGTRIYLNSDSRLRYPTSFVGNGERRVFLEGEAYFVVMKNEKPFIVETLREEIKVFGTEFNVMAYRNEVIVRTTLVKGSVGVNVKGENKGDFQKIVPGEQFCLDRQTGKSSIETVDIFPFVAWKDGLFVSQNDDLESIMRKVARWYDIEVFYQNERLKEKRFFGIMKRQTCLNEVLEIITKAGNVQFNVNGRTVVVTE